MTLSARLEPVLRLPGGGVGTRGHGAGALWTARGEACNVRDHVIVGP